MKNFFYLVLLVVLLSACGDSTDPQKIIDKAIASAGGEKYLSSTIEFDFRERHYLAKRQGGAYSYQRLTQDSTNLIRDFLSNDGFKREINGVEVNVVDSMKVKYTASVNSVIYFALLPYGLNDDAVIKKFVGETQIESKDYYIIEITFKQDGGGEDFEDVFLYWINKESYAIDYMAYSFEENNKADYRFRKAYNSRNVNGIVFLDYINYKPKSETTINQLEELYKRGALEELSKIELINLQVN
ncbi:MAG: hypothetical protein IPK96_13780 [Flammeovirgaceae bacterium]|jgi:hypothetical protein|nr:hypothetical protein [Flammeovirgaceae bacterium]